MGGGVVFGGCDLDYFVIVALETDRGEMMDNSGLSGGWCKG